MKRMTITLATAALAAVIGLGFYLGAEQKPAVSAMETSAGSPPEESLDSVAPNESRPNPASNPGPDRIVAGQGSTHPTAPPPQPTDATDVNSFLQQEIEALVSSQTGFEQKQIIWKRLKETGKLDEAIAELEQRTANDPRAAETAAALGAAYLRKAGLIEDAREKALLAMKADQTLEGALNLDPSNWEARYMKAVGMSYWPPQLNKSQEVIEQFQTLIQQQEAQSPQPQFARSYTWLGDQYQKAGQADFATQVWQRGAVSFPNNEELKTRLASAPSRP